MSSRQLSFLFASRSLATLLGVGRRRRDGFFQRGKLRLLQSPFQFELLVLTAPNVLARFEKRLVLLRLGLLGTHTRGWEDGGVGSG